MTKLKLKKGQFIAVQGTIYRVDHKTSTGDWSLQNPETGEPRQISAAELIGFYMLRQANLKVQDPAKSKEFERQCLAADFASADEDHQTFARRTKTLLDAIIAAGCPRPRKERWPAIIEEAAKRNGVPARSWGHLAKCMKKYLAADRDIRVLLPGYPRRGAGRLKMSDEEFEFFNQQLAAHMLPERPTLHESYGNLKKEYRKIRKTPGCAGWKTPSFSTFYRRITEADPYYVMAARYDKEAADRHYRAVSPGFRAFHALELVEIDHTVADIMLVCDKRRYVIGRPTITIAMDKYSGMVVGLYIGFEPPGVTALMQCLHNMILPKTYIASHFPELARANVEWPAYGIPTQILADNGMEFHSESFKDVCAVLGMDINFARVKAPWIKGMVERFMGSLSKGGLNWMPGKTFSNPLDRGDYNSEGNACITLHEFRMLLHAWIILRHNTKMNSRSYQVPEDLWMQEMERNPPRLPPSAAMVDNLLGIMDRKTLTREGLEFKGLHYNSPQLNMILRDARFQSKKDKHVSFKIDANDLGEVAVIHPITGVVFKVPCTEPEISSGVSKFQHEQHREFLRQRGLNYENREHLILARDQMAEFAQTILARNSTKNRKRVMRALGGMFTDQPKASSAPKIEILTKVEAEAMDRVHAEDDARYREAAKTMQPFFVADAMRPARASTPEANFAEYDAYEDDDIQPFSSRKVDDNGGNDGESE